MHTQNTHCTPRTSTCAYLSHSLLPLFRYLKANGPDGISVCMLKATADSRGGSRIDCRGGGGGLVGQQERSQRKSDQAARALHIRYPVANGINSCAYYSH